MSVAPKLRVRVLGQALVGPALGPFLVGLVLIGLATVGCGGGTQATNASPVPTDPPATTAVHLIDEPANEAAEATAASAEPSPSTFPDPTDSLAPKAPQGSSDSLSTASTNRFGGDSDLAPNPTPGSTTSGASPAPASPSSLDQSRDAPETTAAAATTSTEASPGPGSQTPTTPSPGAESTIEIIVDPQLDEPSTISPTPPTEPAPVSEETAVEVHTAYYRLVEQMNAMFADPSATYDWNAVAVDPIRGALAAEQVQRIEFGQVVRWPVDSVYTDVILGISKADPVTSEVGGSPLRAVRVSTCVVDDAIDTYPAEGREVYQDPVTRWITLVFVDDPTPESGGWKVSSLESATQTDGITPCGLADAPVTDAVAPADLTPPLGLPDFGSDSASVDPVAR